MQQNYDLQNYYKTNMDTRDVIVKKNKQFKFYKGFNPNFYTVTK